MNKIVCAAATAVTLTVAGLGLAGVAGAQTTDDYNPSVCTEDVNGVPTVVPCDQGQVENAGVNAASGAAGAVQGGATLPYTGSDTTVPLAEAGVALVAAGGGLLYVVKRRQGAHHS